MKKTKRICIDTNIIIYFLQANPLFERSVKSIFSKITKGEIRGIISVISISEILSLQASQRELKKLKEVLLTIPNLEILDVNQKIAEEAAKIRRNYHFRLPDSILLATAKISKAKIFITNDKRLKTFKELEVLSL